jgi:hypothetical protein
MVTSPEAAAEADAAAGEGASADTVTAVLSQNARMLYQGVRILAIGTTTAAQPGENLTETAEGEAAAEPAPTGNTGLITFSVTAQAAQYIASVPAGQLYLTLVPDAYEPAVVPPIDLEGLTSLPGETGTQLTPYGPDGEAD